MTHVELQMLSQTIDSHSLMKIIKQGNSDGVAMLRVADPRPAKFTTDTDNGVCRAAPGIVIEELFLTI